MQVDHIFIFSKANGAEADELIKFGLTEGSGRVHTGQGTTNRKFYFTNFFLEILWVHDEAEIQGSRPSCTKLWERSLFYTNEYSPFGLCLVNSEDTDPLFEGSSTYDPEYFPEGMKIDFINDPQLPWIFRLPFKKSDHKPNEPMDHPNEISKLSNVTFGIDRSNQVTELISKQSSDTILFDLSQEKKMILEFDHCKNNSEFHFESLPLMIKY